MFVVSNLFQVRDDLIQEKNFFFKLREATILMIFVDLLPVLMQSQIESTQLV